MVPYGASLPRLALPQGLIVGISERRHVPSMRSFRHPSSLSASRRRHPRHDRGPLEGPNFSIKAGPVCQFLQQPTHNPHSTHPTQPCAHSSSSLPVLIDRSTPFLVHKATYHVRSRPPIFHRQGWISSEGRQEYGHFTVHGLTCSACYSPIPRKPPPSRLVIISRELRTPSLRLCNPTSVPTLCYYDIY